MNGRVLSLGALGVLAGGALMGATGTVPGSEAAEHQIIRIAVTSQLRGSFTSRGISVDRRPGGLAHLAPVLSRLRHGHPDLILVDAGGALRGAPDAVFDQPGSAPALLEAMGRLRYDAATLGERDLLLDRATLSAAIASTAMPWIGANVELRGGAPNLVAARIVVRGGLRVGFIGVAAPGSVVGIPPGFASPRVSDGEAAVRNEAARLRSEERADLLIALGGGGTAGEAQHENALLTGTATPQVAGDLGDRVADLDLVIASRGRPAPRRRGEIRKPAQPNRSYRIPIVEPASGSRAVTLVTMEAERQDDRWRIVNVTQETLWAQEQIDGAILRPMKMRLAALDAHAAESSGAFLLGRTSKRARDACAGALLHAAALRAGQAQFGSEAPALTLLPFIWNWPQYRREDWGRAITRGDLIRWIPQEDRLVSASLTGRQVALLLEPYYRYVQRLRVAPSITLFPGGIDVELHPRRTDAERLSFSGSVGTLEPGRDYRVWMTSFHRFGGGGLAPRALIQADAPVALTEILPREAVMAYLSDAAAPLPDACGRVLTRTAPAPTRKSNRRKRAARVTDASSEAVVFRPAQGPW